MCWEFGLEISAIYEIGIYFIPVSLFQVQEARAAAAKAQQLLENVATRKRNKQSEVGGLIIKKAVYGSAKALKKQDDLEESDELASQIIDVTIPLNFLVSDLGELKV